MAPMDDVVFGVCFIFFPLYFLFLPYRPRVSCSGKLENSSLIWWCPKLKIILFSPKICMVHTGIHPFYDANFSIISCFSKGEELVL